MCMSVKELDIGKRQFSIPGRNTKNSRVTFSRRGMRNKQGFTTHAQTHCFAQ